MIVTKIDEAIGASPMGQVAFSGAGTYSWTVPADADKRNVVFTGWGGGGGGGAADDSNASDMPGYGGTGGHGTLPAEWSTAAAGVVAHAGDVYTIVIGLGGTGG